MSLVGFRAEAHPQQVAAGTANLEKDERYTPLELISTLHARWRFTVDAAGIGAAPASRLIGRFWTREQNGLAQSWADERVWVNPPFSAIPPWVEKTWKSGAEVVVMLIPANRTEQPFWQELIEPYRDRRDSVLRTAFLAKRIAFGTPDAPEGKQWNSSAPPLAAWCSPGTLQPFTVSPTPRGNHEPRYSGPRTRRSSSCCGQDALRPAAEVPCAPERIRGQ